MPTPTPSPSMPLAEQQQCFTQSLDALLQADSPSISLSQATPTTFLCISWSLFHPSWWCHRCPPPPTSSSHLTPAQYQQELYYHTFQDLITRRLSRKWQRPWQQNHHYVGLPYLTKEIAENDAAIKLPDSVLTFKVESERVPRTLQKTNKCKPFDSDLSRKYPRLHHISTAGQIKSWSCINSGSGTLNTNISGWGAGPVEGLNKAKLTFTGGNGDIESDVNYDNALGVAKEGGDAANTDADQGGCLSNTGDSVVTKGTGDAHTDKGAGLSGCKPANTQGDRPVIGEKRKETVNDAGNTPAAKRACTDVANKDQ
ncbi:hypothetical protein DFH07DRAFT_770197 [Mycena maculata]|uniref:Uncharacterized protein n=1 Tax=Mycena maculata TaxID=230809 RepID=A0AAD7JJ12_9AGAR|nr:hypothetical protein DFH07DRAFT_770197 [Mycena maculata]